MTLDKIVEIIEDACTHYNVKDSVKNYMMIDICKKYYKASADDLEVSNYQYSTAPKKIKILLEKNEIIRDAYREVQKKLLNLKKIKRKSPINMVKEFRDAFGLKVKEKPSLLTKTEYDLHYSLIKEELNEYLDACEEGNIVEILDAQLDMLYLIYGCILHHGTHKIVNEGFAEVHSSNMTKLEDGKPVYREDGKVIKGKNFQKPDLHKYIR